MIRRVDLHVIFNTVRTIEGYNKILPLFLNIIQMVDR